MKEALCTPFTAHLPLADSNLYPFSAVNHNQNLPVISELCEYFWRVFETGWFGEFLENVAGARIWCGLV